ncbi:putative 4-hydroxy-4-methyl-2-oxoglutarate aldolase [Sinomonas cellulolyticus]|uniref:4-hydroxy-4-methyl-2-oxoglutarate aldolase n=1 Tax=Sinomonas cellulolyticus TaxID=2801916 RepID=A0ABS1JYF0_9MICC|nr:MULTISPECIES: ribonuclease E activity regulator RraA [Sinomonas]MBL0704228.1 ribonuclease E activity regulator RraA [Sinomonas cellulolyticus]GHG61048.1 putative 4-hydroxy-4-methyl-2-oxoglutarate aldolase [Sinomonas sp. KCTC 49339]
MTTQQTELSTADLYDEYGEQLQSVSTQFQSFGGRARFHGPVRTLKCHEDNLLLKQTLAAPGDGAILVVDGGGSLRCELLGGNMAAQALENGWTGVIVNGAIRDRAELAALPFGVKALGSNPRKGTKTGAGETDLDVAFGGAVFRPGATVYCDEDGILVQR